MKKEELIIASKNKEKIKEIKEILSNFEIISMKDMNIENEIQEDENTFEKNAIKKAKELSNKLKGKICLGDDSGIEIEYLGGFPGVKTKRWCEGTDRQKNLGIIKKLKGVKKEKRKVKSITAIAIVKDEKIIVVKGELEGYISEEVRGKNGFGFDEIFELEDGRTLAQLTNEEKNKISSRKKALEKIKEKINMIDNKKI